MRSRIATGAVALLLIQNYAYGADDPTSKGKSTGTINPATIPIQSQINERVAVNAVLIPPRDVQKIFGKAIADRFAVIQTTVTNPSSDYSLIVHNISTDYSRWLLAGCPQPDAPKPVPPPPPNAGTQTLADKPTDAKVVPVPSANPPADRSTDEKSSGNPTRLTQAVTQPCQISSVELRAMRQVALQGQTDSTRNRFIRYMKTVGSIGTGLTAAGGLGPVLPKAVDAFTGSAVPAFEFLFPDNTINQINLLNDLAYAVNTVVPKDSSHIFMTFFPIDRFLGDYLGNYYRSSPALFYAPLQYYFDKHYDKFFVHVGERIGNVPALVKAMNPDSNVSLTDIKKDDPDYNQKMIKFAVQELSGLSLNMLRIIVDGKFIVETTDVAPTLTGIICAPGQAKNFSTAKSVVNCSMTGTLLSGVDTITIDKMADLGIQKVEVVSDGADDRNLPIKITLGDNAILYNTKLAFTVSKPGKSGALKSGPVTYTVTNFGAESTPTLATIKGPVKIGDTVTLTGTNFWNVDEGDHVQVHFTDTTTQKSFPVLLTTGDITSSTQITFKAPAPAGTYNVTVSYKTLGTSSPAQALTITVAQ